MCQVLKKLKKPKYGRVSALTKGRYDDFGHMVRTRLQRVAGTGGALFYVGTRDGVLNARIEADAEAALKTGPFSVTDKRGCAPSGDKADYYSGAPYWWPNPEAEDGLPYVRRDCDRMPDTELYGAESRRYDRTALQYLIDSVTALTLAGGEKAHGKAAELLRHWFLVSASAMKPNMAYAQVRLGHGGNKGAPAGLIEARDMALLPDCIIRLEGSGALGAEDVEKLKGWFAVLLQWFQNAPQAHKERRSNNNHGTNHDLLCISLALFVGDKKHLKAYVARSLRRLPLQFALDGDQPAEAARPHMLHYCTYNLQSWLLAARALSAAGADMDTARAIFARAAEHLWQRYLGDPAQAVREGFVPQRLVPLLQEIQAHTAAGWIEEALRHADLQTVPECFHPFNGIPPYWRAVVSA